MKKKTHERECPPQKKPLSPFFSFTSYKKNRKFFINWYAGELLAHGERLADAAVSVFGLAEEEDEEGEGEEDAEEEEATAAADAARRDGDEAAATAAATKAAVAAAVSLPSPTTAVPLPPLRREARSTSLASMDSDVGGGANGGGGGGSGGGNNNKGSTAALAAASADGPLGRGPPPAWDRASLPARPRGLSVALKVAGVHWWYRHPSHAAELTGEFFFFFF